METGLSYKKGDFTKEPFCETCCLFYAHMYVSTLGWAKWKQSRFEIKFDDTRLF